MSVMGTLIGIWPKELNADIREKLEYEIALINETLYGEIESEIAKIPDIKFGANPIMVLRDVINMVKEKHRNPLKDLPQCGNEQDFHEWRMDMNEKFKNSPVNMKLVGENEDTDNAHAMARQRKYYLATISGLLQQHGITQEVVEQYLIKTGRLKAGQVLADLNVGNMSGIVNNFESLAIKLKGIM